MGVPDEDPPTMATAAQIVVPHLDHITILLPFKLFIDGKTYRDMTHFCNRAACTCLLIECL